MRNNSQTQFERFLCSIQVGYADAVNEVIDVAEMYSGPRVATAAAKMGLRSGWALDLSTKNEAGNPWDFTRADMRDKAARKLVEDKPLVLIGSPPCTDWSTFMNLNWDRMDPDVVAERKKMARVDLEFCMELYKIQHDPGRHFLHEHPDPLRRGMGTLSRNFAKRGCTADQCRYGLKTQGPQGEGPAQNPTKLMTISASIANQLQRKCPNRMTHNKRAYEHIPLMNGRAKAAQPYPNAPCRAICRGIVQQIRADRRGKLIIVALHASDAAEANTEGDEIIQQVKLAEDEDHPELVDAYDDVSGVPLDPDMLYNARMEEVEFTRGTKLYDNVHIEDCWQNTREGPISTKWIDINKGDGKCSNYQFRNVAREFAYKKQDGLFAATPPLEVMKLLLSTLASGNKGEKTYGCQRQARICSCTLQDIDLNPSARRRHIVG